MSEYSLRAASIISFSWAADLSEISDAKRSGRARLESSVSADDMLVKGFYMPRKKRVLSEFPAIVFGE
jgi:hypothetical protein